MKVRSVKADYLGVAEAEALTGADDRQAAAPNRKTQEISELLEALRCNPIEGMAKIAGDPNNTPELRARMYAGLARYAYPKLKAVDHRGADQEPLTIVVRRLDRPE
jgi:hypothetical protein